MAKKKGTPQFEIFRNDKGEMQARLRAANGEIVAGGEGYTRRRGVERFIEILRGCANYPVVDITFHKKPTTPAKAIPDKTPA